MQDSFGEHLNSVDDEHIKTYSRPEQLSLACKSIIVSKQWHTHQNTRSELCLGQALQKPIKTGSMTGKLLTIPEQCQWQVSQ